MMLKMKNPRLFFILCATMLASMAAQADEIKILTAGAFKPVVTALAPEFERRTGHTLRIDNATAGALVKRISDGEAFDLVVLPSSGIEQLTKDGKLSASASVRLARVAIGIAVKSGAAMPDISSVAKFKDVLLSARSVAYIDPTAGGSSGIYLAGLFERMGIAADMKRKAVLVPGGLVAERVVNGEADMAIHQISEIVAVQGAVLVGPLPAELQNYTTYVGGMASKAANAQAAQAFLSVLSSPAVQALLEAKGMEKP